MMGEGEQVDPEEVVAVPSGEAIVHSSGNMPPFLSFSLLLFYFFSQNISSTILSCVLL